MKNDDLHKGYVDNWQDYVDDLAHLMSDVVLKQTNGKPVYFLSHSMGGAIATAYLIQNPKAVTAMVAVSPM